jgi:phosphoglycerate dehydrogenase-like enzyme
VAEFAVGMIILALRQSIARSTAYANGEPYSSLRSDGWRGWDCNDLTTRTVGLIGLSQVGKRMPPLLSPFGCRIVAYDPYWDAAQASALGVDLLEDLDELLVQSDVVSLHTPVTDETHGLIDARRVGLLRKGAVFVNTARSACTDQDALFSRASRDEIQVYTDVTSPEPLLPNHDAWQCPNIFITPHVAGPTEETRRREGLFAVEEIERYLTGQPLLGEVTLDRYDIVA